MVSGLMLISGFTASLLLNLEGVFTALIAVIIFREREGKRLWASYYHDAGERPIDL